MKSRRVDARALECIASTRVLSKIRKLGERRRSARLVSAYRPGHQPLGFAGKGIGKGYLPGRIEDQEVGCRTLSGCTPERTVLDIRMMLRIVVMQAVCGDRHLERGTQFQLKRRAVRRHEAGRDIGTKQQRGQHDDGRNAKASATKRPFAHTRKLSDARGALIVSRTARIWLTPGGQRGRDRARRPARVEQSPLAVARNTGQNFQASPPKNPRRGPYCGAKTPTPLPLLIS